LFPERAERNIDIARVDRDVGQSCRMSRIPRDVAGTFAMPHDPKFRRPPLTQGLILFFNRSTRLFAEIKRIRGLRVPVDTAGCDSSTSTPTCDDLPLGHQSAPP
jgi:hypothetical protein